MLLHPLLMHGQLLIVKPCMLWQIDWSQSRGTWWDSSVRRL